MNNKVFDELLFTSPDGDDMYPASGITNNEDGSYSFEVTTEDGSVRYRHAIKTEEI